MDVVASMHALLFISWFCSEFIFAKANVTTIQILRDSGTSVSSNGNFKIGFFSPVNSTNRYVGIWYNNKEFDSSEVVWVANRESPLSDHSGVLKVSEEGVLQVLNGQGNVFWSSNPSAIANDSVAQLLDSGNLVVRSSATDGLIIWQSFKHPTDSLLPPVTFNNLSKNLLLQSWKSPSNPSRGRFKLGMNLRQLPEFFIWDGDSPYWRSGPGNGNLFLGVAYMHSEVATGFHFIDNRDGTYELSYSVANQSLLERLVLSYDGILLQKDWDVDGSGKKEIVWQSLQSECDIFGKCGPFGSCDPKKTPICSCLRGFVPKNNEEWSKSNWTSGCKRRKPLQCGSTGGKTDGFWPLEHMKVPDNAQWLLADPDSCGQKCLENCLCLAYAYYSGIGCMFWNDSLIDIQQFSADGAQLYIRLARSEIGETRKWKIIIAAVVIMGTAMLLFFMYYLWRWKSQHGKKIMDKETLSTNCMFDARMVQVDLQDLLLFDFEKLVVATNNFLGKNKLGQGGFGPVYKGKLEDGQEIAVKRLSRASGQGLQEFKNEVVVISKLQHKNLVRLLGCCVEGEEKLLVYEYMPNNSLDAHLFDPLYQGVLNWKKRFNIIKGICRGLLYLHRDSRLRIIHRDLKAGNILLDDDLEPKISDFGMARIFGGKQDQANTLRVVGTYGYMSPEYAMEGRFSEKSDVYSFGVLLLEIVSGRRNCNFQDGESLNLLAHAWKLWNEDDILKLANPIITDPSYEGEISRCIQVGLLCVQELPEDRPSISTIISMLDTSEMVDVPYPRQPGFTRRKISPPEFHQNSREFCSVNHVSLTSISGR